jgi:hypothetical protein
MLRAAATGGSDDTLAAELRIAGRINATEERRTPRGGMTVARVPVTAADTLAEGEFNRFYARALCRRAIEEQRPSVTVYRAKAVENPRSTSEALIGRSFSPLALLADLRQHVGTDTALGLPPGLPPGPNSGLSIQLQPLTSAVAFK